MAGIDAVSEALGSLDARVGNIEATQTAMAKSLKDILDILAAEVAGCPFQPQRGTNGDALMSRVDAVEKTLAMNRVYLRGILIGVSAMGLIQLGPPGWTTLLKFFMG